MKAIIKKVIIGIALSLLFVVLTTSLNTALAQTVRVDYQYAGGNAIIDVPGQTRIRLIASGMWSSDFRKADRIQFSVDTGLTNPAGLPIWKPGVAAYEDDPERAAFSNEEIASGTVTYLVKPGHIQVLRIGKSSDVIIHWTIPLVIPATDAPNPTPEVTLPPGMLVLRGYGEALSGYTAPTPFGPNGWIMEIETPTYYLASATLFCQRWNYKWKPVAEAFVGTPMEPRSVTDRIWTWTLP